MKRRDVLVSLLLAVLTLPWTSAYGYKYPAIESNVAYGSHSHESIDVVLPPKGTSPYPVVICFGGLWVSGKDPRITDSIVPQGVAAIAVQSRGLGDAVAAKMNPPIQWPMEDAVRVVQFVRLNAAKWNLDPNRIALAGASQAALPALYVACSGEKANPNATDPVDRVSTKVLGVAVLAGQPSIDPKQMQAWVPGVKWGAPALGMSFDESLKEYDKVLPFIKEWSPDALLTRDAPPIYFFNNEGLTGPPPNIDPMAFKVHSPLWGLGFQKMAVERGDTNVYVQFPGHDVPGMKTYQDFLRKILMPN